MCDGIGIKSGVGHFLCTWAFLELLLCIIGYAYFVRQFRQFCASYDSYTYFALLFEDWKVASEYVFIYGTVSSKITLLDCFSSFQI